MQGTRIKGMEKKMALVWFEKAGRTALKMGSLSHTHTVSVQTHTHMTTDKKNAEQCRQL